ncbi:hypothetical protein DL762_008185 [Monosporascus cannonballus]|uniref:Glycosyl hydrolase family 95 N-terminal domain-containing protein n=1 Tax=Monosporascus cannonballus TaxID=155416 RepID=A0ABY0GX02_9PEZI|nr:hypothetical protein DL762_008185 [Monosporascus cannonballus]
MRIHAAVTLAAASGCYAASQASHLLWYSAPANRDFLAALPIGNGKLGASIHGYTDQELIRLNEDSIWSGGPIDRVNPKALSALPVIREQLNVGNLTEAGKTWQANFIGTPTTDMRAYQPAGELRLDFPHDLNGTRRYNHTLDVSNGINKLSYVYGDVTYTREAFGNYPANVLAFHLRASQPGALSFNVSLTRQQNVTEQSVDLDRLSLSLSGHGRQDDYHKFASQLRLVLPQSSRTGSVSANGTALMVQGATEVWFVYGAESSFHNPDLSYEDVLDSGLNAAVEAGYEALRFEAISDYQQYYERTSIDLGDSGANGQLATPVRLDNWKRVYNITGDPELLALAFNMGKYLLIQSSRPGTLPANLQGVWNRDFSPPWDSKFTLNINLQMNYWLAQPLNLPEISEPVYDLLDRMRVRGADVARRMYGAEGFTCHHNTDITTDCVPFHQNHIDSPFPLGGAWLAFEAIEQFRFRPSDAGFVRRRALPIVRDAAAFIRSFATRDNATGRWWVTSPSCSPENSYYIPEGMTEVGDTTGLDGQGVLGDRAIMWEVMTGYLEMLRATGGEGDTAEEIAAVEDFRARIQPPETGSFGQMLEWSAEFRENHPGHRHFTPFIGLQPGSWVSPLRNASAASGARILLKHRMDHGAGGTSWSIAWAAILHARLLDAAGALRSAVTYLSTWVFPNLFSRNGGYFQMDANSGITAAVLEMLLQSHAGVVHLGPALPGTGTGFAPSGSFRGWVARGGFLVDMTWRDGRVTGARIRSLSGSPLTVRVQDGRPFKLDGVQAAKQASLETTAGTTYVVSF